jgi:hypothetical protein
LQAGVPRSYQCLYPLNRDTYLRKSNQDSNRVVINTRVVRENKLHKMGKGDELEHPDRVSVRQGEDREAYPILEIPVDPRNKSCKAGKETTKCISESSSGT